MDQIAILRDYQSLRRVSIDLSTRLAQTLSSDEISAAAKALGMLHGKTIDVETKDEIAVMMDYAIHDLSRDGRNAVQRMLEDHPPPEGSAELRLLRSMRNSHYTLLAVQAPIPGFGVRGFDGVEQKPIVVVDVGFGTTAVPGAALATRLHSPGEGWWMTMGAALPINADAMQRIHDAIEDHQRRFNAQPTDQERSTMIIRSCIASGASRQIRYADMDNPAARRAAAPATRNPAKVGRNDPCPCGSGRKYKKCCVR